VPFQTVIFRDSISLGDNDTSYTATLPANALISHIWIRIYGTGGSGSPDVSNVLSRVVVSASSPSETYVDLTGDELLLRDRQLLGVQPREVNSAGGSSEANWIIFFGRRLFDKRLMLDTGRHEVVQLRLTFSNLVSANTFASGTVKLTIYLARWVGGRPGEFVGTVKQTEYHVEASGTGVAALDLPRGNAYDTIILIAGTPANITYVTFGVDNKRETPLQYTFAELQEINKLLYGFSAQLTDTVFVDFTQLNKGHDGDLTELYATSLDHIYTLYVDRGTGGSTLKTVVCEVIRA